ncbi:unnamed protein product [Hyaloperonospora brassicae]|uniref:JmjC domain-containing protein n=1 Tax=Hyaloperonospora brassicae TaxID=162125 RepID=A0AAV0UCL0_HYABA|nr:unnamed protein product [Hyaloperonospora brassicae]
MEMTQVEALQLIVLPPRFLQHLRDAGGAAIADLLQRAIAVEEEAEPLAAITTSEKHAALEMLASAAYERTWEKLHCGSWNDVLPVWRQAFGLASVLQAVCLLRRQRLSDCLKTLDMCLMMAGPFAPSETHQFLAGVEQQLEEQRLSKKEKVRCVKKLRLEKRMLFAAGDAKEQEQKLAFPLRKMKTPTLEEFRNHIMMQNKPVVITGAMEFWPALGRAAGPDRAWNSEKYIRCVAGLRTVPIEVGSSYTGDDWGQELMTISDFLDRHILPQLEDATNATDSDTSESHAPSSSEKLGYLAQHRLFDQIPALGRDIVIPDYCTIQRADDHTSNDEDEDITINCWFGPGETVSPLHFDRKDNLLCQVVGIKYVRLFAPQESEKLYAMEGLLSNTSQVQVENPDIEKFPDFCHAKYVECILGEGEMLYIPPKYWHYVKSLSTSFSVSFWWS